MAVPALGEIFSYLMTPKNGWLLGAGIVITLTTWLVILHFWDERIDVPTMVNEGVQPPVKPFEINPQDLPREQFTPPQTMPVSQPQQNFNVTSNNQQGGITAGQVNIGDQPRTLTLEQQGIIASKINGAVKSKVCFMFESSAKDSATYGGYMAKALQKGGCNVLIDDPSWETRVPPIKNVTVTPPDSSDSILIASALKAAGIDVLLTSSPINNGVVLITIGF